MFHSHRRHVATPLFLSRYNISKGLSNDLWLCCWLAQVQRQCAEERLDRRRRQQQPAWRPTARKTGSGGRRTGSCRRNCWLAAPDSLHHTQRTQDGMTWQVYSLDNSHCADIRSRYFKHKELIHRNSYHPPPPPLENIFSPQRIISCSFISFPLQLPKGPNYG